MGVVGYKHWRSRCDAGRRSTIELTEPVRTRDFAAYIEIPLNRLIADLMDLDIFVSANCLLDKVTIRRMAVRYGFRATFQLK
jgi:hypothetical protein